MEIGILVVASVLLGMAVGAGVVLVILIRTFFDAWP